MKFTQVLDSENRIDKLYEYFSIASRSAFSKAIEEGDLKVNGNNVNSKYKLKKGDEVIFIKNEKDYLAHQDFLIDIIYEDNDLIAINKDKNIAVHPAKSYDGLTLVQGLLSKGIKLSDGEDPLRPGVFHRLDMDTTGVIILAKNNEIHKEMKELFMKKRITKNYKAIVNGSIKFQNLTVNNFIGRNPNNPTKMAVLKEGREAISHFYKIDSNENYSYVDCFIETGRTHQIRVHLSNLNYPIIGDKVYGLSKEKIKADRQMLHAYSVKFIHPKTKKELKIIAPLKDDMKEILIKTDLMDQQL